MLTFRPDGSLTLRTDRTFFMGGRNGTCITTETGRYVVLASKRALKNALHVRCAVDNVTETRSSLSGPGTKTTRVALSRQQVRLCVSCPFRSLCVTLFAWFGIGALVFRAAVFGATAGRFVVPASGRRLWAANVCTCHEIACHD